MSQENNATAIFKESLKLMKELHDILKEVQVILKHLPTKDFIIGKLELMEEKLKNIVAVTHDPEATQSLKEIHQYITELKRAKSIKKSLSDLDKGGF